jgi:hypothetical protein
MVQQEQQCLYAAFYINIATKHNFHEIITAGNILCARVDLGLDPRPAQRIGTRDGHCSILMDCINVKFN